jgi:prolyl-tRNA editing enzyme YbaK/EbsC (Cys-tRNA(Pro) deacylase)
MTCEKVQHFKVQLLQSDRTSEFAAIAPKTRSLKISAAATAIGTLLILLAPPVEAVNLTLVSDRAPWEVQIALIGRF